MITFEEIKKSNDYVRSIIGEQKIEVGVVLGSGFSHLLSLMTSDYCIPYADIPNFPLSTVEGHEGAFHFGRIHGKYLVVMSGRLHYYEGYSLQEVTLPIRVMGMLGISTLILTNAAGGVNRLFQVGDVMVLKDHINLLPENPLRGANLAQFGERFPAMTNVYDKELLRMALSQAKNIGIPIREGVYAALQGPSYETDAEYNWLRIIGADAVGMSTVPEAIVGAHMSIRCLALSLITNSSADTKLKTTTHEDVLAVATQRQNQLKLLLEAIISHL